MGVTSRRLPTVLHASFDAPGWGGGGTTAYALFARRQRDGARVHFVNLVTDGDATRLQRILGPEFDNPRRLADVHTCRLTGSWWRAHDELVALVERVRPDAILAHGFLATALMRFAAPRVPLVFLTTGSPRVKRLIESGELSDFAEFTHLLKRGVVFTVPPGDKELQAVDASDLVILHSPHMRVVYEHLFYGRMGKVYDALVSVADIVHGEVAPYASLSRPFEERDIDVIAVASEWTRIEKNYAAVRRVATTCPELRVHLVGLAEPDNAPLHRHGLLPRAEVFALLGRAKALICPSLFDAAPGVLFEAALLGCNVVASRNCGNWTLCPEQLLARSPEEFAACARRAVKAPLPANVEPFLGGYADLVETVEAFVG